MVLIINHAFDPKKNIAIIEIYCTMGTCNDNVCHLRIVIEPQIYVVEHVYLYPSDLNFYLDIIDLYACFGTDFVSRKRVHIR